MMKTIIVNADDFGINEVVTSEIERMILAGAVSSTTVMANGECLEEVKRFAVDHPEASYGIHLCLSEYDSITKNDGLFHAGITDEKGRFVHKAVFHLRNLTETDVQKAIREELNEQIDVVSSLGFPISHADSHHHVHTIYPLRELFADVLQKRGIKKVRLCSDFLTFRTRRHLVLWLRNMRIKNYYKSRFITTEAFYPYADYLKMGVKRGDQVVELMCHPGHPGQQFRDEMNLVEAKAAFNNANVKLITYNDLH